MLQFAIRQNSRGFFVISTIDIAIVGILPPRVSSRMHAVMFSTHPIFLAVQQPLLGTAVRATITTTTITG